MPGSKPQTAPVQHGHPRQRVPGWRLASFAPAPTMETFAEVAPTRVALLGRDYPGARLDVVVEEGDRVACGAVVMRDHRHPEVAFTAPAGGVVSRIRRGARRALRSLEIRVTGDQAPVRIPVPAEPGVADIRQLMLASGAWTSLRTRPFGYLPAPADLPAAVFVNALDTRPLAPAPTAIIGLHPDWFKAGMNALATLTSSPVFLCIPPDTVLPLPNADNIRLAEFAGPHPAGLPGVHIQACCPVGNGRRQVWQVDYAAVMSLGRLMLEGTPWQHRIVSVAGPGCGKPRLVSAPRGSAVSDLTADCLLQDNVRLLSGSPVDGHPLQGLQDYLGHDQHQLTALSGRAGPVELSPERAWPLIPTQDLDRHAPPGILAAPLLRALLVGDTDRARQLGALELLEEDLAGISAVCSTGIDFGQRLRQTLDRIARDEA